MGIPFVQKNLGRNARPVPFAVGKRGKCGNLSRSKNFFFPYSLHLRNRTQNVHSDLEATSCTRQQLIPNKMQTNGVGFRLIEEECGNRFPNICSQLIP